MVTINKTFVKSPTGICLIILTILSFIASILTQFYCRSGKGKGDVPTQCCSFIHDMSGLNPYIYGPTVADFALTLTWIGSLILFILKLCSVLKADIKCWKITDYVMSGLMLLVCFIGFVSIIASMIEMALIEEYRRPLQSQTSIAATVFLAADIGILIFMVIAITRHYRHKEGDIEAKHQNDVKEGMDDPSLKIKSISLSKQGNELKDPTTEPTPVSSSTQAKMKQKVETVTNTAEIPPIVPPIVPPVVPPIPEPKADSSEHESEGTKVKNQSDKTEEPTEKTQENESESGAKEKKAKKIKKKVKV